MPTAELPAASARPGVPPVGLLLLAVVSIQVGAALAQGLFGQIGPGGTVFLRVLFAALVLLAVWRPRLRGRSRAELRLLLAFGLALAGMNAAFYASIERIPLGIAVTLEFVGPLGLAVAASRRARDLAWAGLAGAGVALLAPWGGARLDPVGVGLALVAAAFWAAYIPLAARAGQLAPGGGALALSMVVTALALAPGGLMAGPALVRPEVLLAGFGVALLSSAVPYSLELEALRWLPQRVFSVLLSLEPAVAALAGLVLLGEGLLARELFAVGLVVLASLGVTLERREMAVPVAPEA